MNNLIQVNGKWFLGQRSQRHSSPSKQRRDRVRDERRLERQRILNEAYYDQGYGSNPSPGEVDARTYSIPLGVFPGLVLRDPKLRFVDRSLKF